MMATNKITVQLEGAAEDNKHVTLSAFLSQLEAVKTALKQTERLVTGDEEASVYYRIVDLRHGSPATVVLEAVSFANRPWPGPKKARIAKRGDYSEATVKQFFNSLAGIRERKQAPAKADLQLLQAYRNLVAHPENRVSSIKLINTDESIEIDRQFETAIDEIIGLDEVFEGTICGTLEKINLHNATRFDIFPSIGPKQVICEFKPSLKEAVIRAIDQYVCVAGKLRYKRLENFPYAVDAENIEILPPDNELPTLFDVQGMAPDLTAQKGAMAFLEEIRNGESW